MLIKQLLNDFNEDPSFPMQTKKPRLTDGMTRKQILQRNQEIQENYLDFLNDFKIADLETIRLITDEPLKTVENRLSRMTKEKTMKTWRRNGVKLYSPTKKGINLVGGDMKTITDLPLSWRHTHILSRIGIEGHLKGYATVVERHIRKSLIDNFGMDYKNKLREVRNIHQDEFCYYTIVDVLSGKLFIPDLVLASSGKNIMIEVELYRKSSKDLYIEKIDGYNKNRSKVFQVCWYVDKKRDADYIENIIAECGQSGLHQVYILSDCYG
jgi:hypothetical protein